MQIKEVTDIYDKEIAVYSSLTEHQLKSSTRDFGLFIAESPKVIKVAVEEGYEPLSLLCERKHIEGDAAGIISQFPDITVYTGERDVLAALTGYRLTRGVLSAMRRKQPISPEKICRGSRRIAVIDNVCDTTNIGSIFRSAVALGIDGILLTPDSCDPFNRRAVRVSMGTVFKIPWSFCIKPLPLLKEIGFITVALALHKDSIPIDDPKLKDYQYLAMVLGAEGDGLAAEVIAECDYKAIIPMFRHVDSLNVGAAAAVAFWELRHKD